MKGFAEIYRYFPNYLRARVSYFIHHYKWLIARKTTSLQRRVLYLLRIFRAKEELQTLRDRRFLELQGLLKDYLIQCIYNDSQYAKSVAGQLLNVLKHCDEITYEEAGTAEAYALLHFLDRYHRFQIIFDTIYETGLMPIPTRKINILDVGTGPGPSMYAISDFYSNLYSKGKITHQGRINENFSIDYVERSPEFRDWLHHFTEYVNEYCPSNKPWLVPYHHGTFYDFQGLEFDQYRTYLDYDDEGEYITRAHVEKFRFDVIVFSNFLTTKEQVASFSAELKDCVRFLRNKGILIIVGAKSSSNKYRAVYEEISNAILSENYNNWKFIASCEKLDLGNPVMGYSWNDPYGEKVKELIGAVYGILQTFDEVSMSQEIIEVLEKTIQPSYIRPIEWEVHIFRKRARMRKKPT